MKTKKQLVSLQLNIANTAVFFYLLIFGFYFKPWESESTAVILYFAGIFFIHFITWLCFKVYRKKHGCE